MAQQMEQQVPVKTTEPKETSEENLAKKELI